MNIISYIVFSLVIDHHISTARVVRSLQSRAIDDSDEANASK